MSLFAQLKSLIIKGEKANYTAIAFSAMNRTVPHGMSPMLKERGEYEDILQDARAAAVEALAQDMTPNDAYCHASRRVYAGMVNLGYRKERHTGRWSRKYSEMEYELATDDDGIYT